MPPPMKCILQMYWHWSNIRKYQYIGWFFVFAHVALQSENRGAQKMPPTMVTTKSPTWSKRNNRTPCFLQFRWCTTHYDINARFPKPWISQQQLPLTKETNFHPNSKCSNLRLQIRRGEKLGNFRLCHLQPHSLHVHWR